LRVTSGSRRFHPHAGKRLDLDDVRLLTLPNTTARTRFSVDSRTVNLDHVVERVGTPNVDSACTGTTLRDFLRGSDLRPLPEEVIAGHGKRTAAATLVAPSTRPVS